MVSRYKCCVIQRFMRLCREYTPLTTVGVPMAIMFYKRPSESLLTMILLTPRPPLSTAVSLLSRGNNSYVDY